MDRADDALEALRRLRKKHGKVLSLNLVFKTFLQNKLYVSKQAIVGCLRALQRQKKIKPINFGINIELLENVKPEAANHVQSSLNGFKAKKSA